MVTLLLFRHVCSAWQSICCGETWPRQYCWMLPNCFTFNERTTLQLIGPWEIWMWFWKYNFQLCFDDWYLMIMSLDDKSTDDKSILFHVMAWCRQATSYYLSQYWCRSTLPYGIINILSPICNDDIQSTQIIQNHWFLKKLERRCVSLDGQHCGCWWTTMVRC